MVKMNLKPGDKVKIKTWDAMKEEFGMHTFWPDSIGTLLWSPDTEKSLPEDRIIVLGGEILEGALDLIFNWEGHGIPSKAVECLVSRNESIEPEDEPPAEAEANEAKAEDVSPFYWEGPCELQKARAETLENVVTRKNRQLLRLEEEIHRLRDSDSGGTKEAFSELEYRCQRSEERIRIIESVINPDID